MYRILKRVVIAVGVASVLAIAISAFRLIDHASAGANPLQEFGAAQSAPIALDANARGELEATVAGIGGSVGGQVLSEARALHSTVDGQPTYAIPSSTGDFCLFVEGVGEGCRPPLTSTQPLLFVVSDPDVDGAGVGPTAYGVAADGVESVTLTVGGIAHTVPVHGNVFEFDGPSSATVGEFTTVIANFSDGHSVSVP